MVAMCMHSYLEVFQVFIISVSERSLPRGSVLYKLCDLEVHTFLFYQMKRGLWLFLQPLFVENQPSWKGCTWIWVLSLV